MRAVVAASETRALETRTIMFSITRNFDPSSYAKRVGGQRKSGQKKKHRVPSTVGRHPDPGTPTSDNESQIPTRRISRRSDGDSTCHGRPSDPQTSDSGYADVCTPTNGTGTELPSQKQTDKVNCDLCGRGELDERYRCRDCAIDLCSGCIVNGRVLHPSHTIKRYDKSHAEADDDDYDPSSDDLDNTTGTGDTSEREDSGGDDSHQDDLSGDDPDESDSSVEIIQVLTRQFSCFYCQLPLSELRYECAECTGSMNFCSDCCQLHPSQHTLNIIDSRKSPVRKVEDDGDWGGFGPDLDDNHGLRNSTCRGVEPTIEGDDDAQQLRQQAHNATMIPFPKKGILHLKKMAQQLTKVVQLLEQSQQQAVIPDSDDEDFSLFDFDLNDIVSPPKPAARRIWRPREKRRLQRLKEKGYSDRQIASLLKRTPAAINQQWRKLRLENA